MEAAGNVCAVPGCNRKYGERGAVSLFRFPKDNDRCRHWAIACGLLRLFETKLRYDHKLYGLSIRVCDRHFTPESFCHAEGRRKRLKPNALPTLHLGGRIAAVQENPENPPVDPPAELLVREAGTDAPVADAAVQPLVDPRGQEVEQIECLPGPNPTSDDGLPEERRPCDRCRRLIAEANRRADYYRRQIAEAKRRTDYAKRRADYAKRRADYAKRRADYAKRRAAFYRRQLDTTLEALAVEQEVSEARRRQLEAMQQQLRRDVHREAVLKAKLYRARHGLGR